jgi:hypothetical protein
MLNSRVTKLSAVGETNFVQLATVMSWMMFLRPPASCYNQSKSTFILAILPVAGSNNFVFQLKK